MIPERDPGDRLRAALSRTIDDYTPSSAPVDRILAAGRSRRTRRRRAAVTAAAACVAAVAAVSPAVRPSGPRTAAPPAASHPPQRATTAPPPAPPAVPTSTDVAGGTVDGVSWSVGLTYYPAVPEGFRIDPVPGMPAPRFTSLLCRRVVIGGTVVDHQGGPWADCDTLNGADDPVWSDVDGPHGLHDKGTSGTRVFVGGTTDTATAYGTVTFTDGTHLTGRAVTIVHTGYTTWAVPVTRDKVIASVDEYDTGHHRLTHTTTWK